jgi:protease-4
VEGDPRVLGYALYLVRYVLWIVGNLGRRLRKPPDYVVFILEDSYPELPAPRAGYLRRRLFHGDRLSLQELGEQFRALQQDPRIKGVVLHLRNLQMPAAQIQTLREFIANLRGSGKRVVAWSTGFDNARYYVATAADEVLLQTGGEASPLGLRSTAVFLGDALERVGLKADFIQISPYKSAADPLMRSSMSEEAREMANWLADAYYDDFIEAIASGRNIGIGAAKALVDGAPYTDLRALDAGVVDRLISEEELPTYLRDGDKPARLATWEAARPRLLRPPPIVRGLYVALIRIEGVIIDGRSQRPPFKSPLPLPLVFEPRAGDLSVVQQARAALADRRAAAVVLYVNSGGGSSSASEAMAAALQRLAAKKPLVAVMGPIAASGGYYVCTPAQWISAQPGTLTGSIGVLSGKLVSAGLLDKLLFRRESIGRGLHSDFDGTERPFNEEERKIVWDNIQRVYDIFLDRVTAARFMPRDVADGVSGGRVWTGSQALEKGLVDELGGLENGLAKARQLAGLHPRAPVHEVRADRSQVQPPLPNPSSMVSYAIEGLNMLGGGKALCLCGLVTPEAHADS